METTVTFRWFAPLFFMFCLALPLAAVKGGEKRPSHIGHRHIVNMPRGPRPGLPFTEVKKKGGKDESGGYLNGPFFSFLSFLPFALSGVNSQVQTWTGSFRVCRDLSLRTKTKVPRPTVRINRSLLVTTSVDSLCCCAPRAC